MATPTATTTTTPTMQPTTPPPTPTPTPTPPVLRINLHSLLQTSHTNHGIIQQDYSQYSSYCTRRLSRLRHASAVKRELLHARAYKNAWSTRRVVVVDGKEQQQQQQQQQQQGGKSKHAYRSIDMTNLPSDVVASHVNYLLEPLYCAERCWASFMHFKSSIIGGGNNNNNDDNTKESSSRGKIRARSMKRLRKAAGYATLVETLALATTTMTTAGSGGGGGNGNGNVDEEEEEEQGKEREEEKEAEVRQQQPPVDQHTQMEARAYACWMRGNLALETNQWQEACTEYQSSLTLCQALANSSGKSDTSNNAVTTTTDGNGGAGNNNNKLQQLELFDFFTTRAQHVIAPLLRYCQYELKEKEMSPNEKISFLQSSSSLQESHHSSSLPITTSSSDPLQSKLNSLLKTETIQNQATSGSGMSQIVFRENNIVVETKELRMALLKIQDLKSDWEELLTTATSNSSSGSSNDNTTNNNNGASNSDAKLMALLSGYDDTISLANQELKQLSALKSGPAVNAKKFQLMNILGYTKFQKLKLVMARNEGLINDILRKQGGDGSGKSSKKTEMTLKHMEEVAHLYDALLQDARAVASLPGGGSPDDISATPVVIVEDEFLLEANANILRLRSLRCYYLARMHASPLVRKYAQAVALLEQAESLAKEAVEEIGACEKMEGGDDMLERLESVVEEMKGEKCRVLAISYLSKSLSSSSSSSGRILLERLQDYNIPSSCSISNIAHVPPKLEPMACKPSFFDVALNYVSEYPLEELESAMEVHMGNKDAAGATTGFLGWFRR